MDDEKRFYLKEEYSPNTPVLLTGGEHHHLFRVMRLREGDEIELVDGLGAIGLARINKIEKEKTQLQVLHTEQQTRSSTQILIGLPLMRPSKLEWVIEKGTELGADSFCLYSADHSTQDSLSEHQMDRLRHLTIAAMKQSRRLFLPHLEILPHLRSLALKEARLFFGDTRISAPVFERGPKETTLFITGPESGFSEEELELLKGKAQGVRINPNVLRAETAPIVALSLLCV